MKLKKINFSEMACFLEVNPKTVKRIYYGETTKVDSLLWLKFCSYMNIDPFSGKEGLCRVPGIETFDLMHFFSKNYDQADLIATNILIFAHIEFIKMKVGIEECDRIIRYCLEIDPDYFTILNAPIPQFCSLRMIKFISQMSWDDEFFKQGYDVLSSKGPKALAISKDDSLINVKNFVGLAPTITKGVNFRVFDETDSSIVIEANIRSLVIRTLRDEGLPNYFIDLGHQQCLGFYAGVIDKAHDNVKAQLTMKDRYTSLITIERLEA